MPEPTRIAALPLIPPDVQARIAGDLTEDPHRLRESPEEAAARREQADRVRCGLWYARVPKRFKAAWPDKCTPEQGGDRNPPLAAAFVDEPEPRTLVLYSAEPGVGKSYTAYAAGRYAVHERRLFAAAWTMIEFNDAIRPNGDGTALTLAQSVDLLILDDLGRERITEWTLERLHMVIDRRWRDRRKTIITTNLTGPDFVARYGEPIVDRITDDMWRFEVKGESRRAPAPW